MQEANLSSPSRVVVTRSKSRSQLAEVQSPASIDETSTSSKSLSNNNRSFVAIGIEKSFLKQLSSNGIGPAVPSPRQSSTSQADSKFSGSKVLKASSSEPNTSSENTDVSLKQSSVSDTKNILGKSLQILNGTERLSQIASPVTAGKLAMKESAHKKSSPKKLHSSLTVIHSKRSNLLQDENSHKCVKCDQYFSGDHRCPLTRGSLRSADRRSARVSRLYSRRLSNK